jgi:hypothetical protein
MTKKIDYLDKYSVNLSEYNCTKKDLENINSLLSDAELLAQRYFNVIDGGVILKRDLQSYISCDELTCEKIAELIYKKVNPVSKRLIY